jgi:hypothetical protein
VDGITVTLEGEQRYQNSIVVKNGGKILVGPSGVLKLRAQTISVDAASLISANAVGEGEDWVQYTVWGGDLSTAEGYKYNSYFGGGIIDLRAKLIRIDGQVTSNGGGSYASGGTVLLAADELLGTGALQALCTYNTSHTYQGVLKLLYGATRTLTPLATAPQSISLMPPMELVSSTHPDSALTYTDGAATLELAWQRPFSGVNGYYYLLSTNERADVSPANGTFLQAESVSIPLKGINSTRYLHIISVDSKAQVGTVHHVFPIRIVSNPPYVSSSSHPSQGTWYNNNAAYLTWEPAQAASDLTGYYYVLDKFGDTVPSATQGTYVPNPQTLLSNLTPGPWVFHLVGRDTQNRTHRTARHFKLFIGAAPATGNIAGSVFEGTQPLSGAELSVNRGLFASQTGATGTYTFGSSVYEGTWEVTASKEGYAPQTKTVTVTGGAVASENFVLTKLP